MGGDRVPKDHPAITALGDIDELNSALGFARAAPLPRSLDVRLADIQNDLFIVGSDIIASQDHEIPRVTPEMVEKLEIWIAEWNRRLPELREFVLPGGNEAGARLHLARAICRRAERSVAALLKTEHHSEFLLPFLNRLSDALFVMARYANKLAKQREHSARFSRRTRKT